jgi:glycosyltransferase involved in cell wall biosynthesis
MSESPRVTIGLPVYNSERYVEQSLSSLLAQTYTDFVLIISDNSSTDRTEEICRDFAAGDKRIQYTRNDKNIGNPGNFNRIFRLSTTPFLKWSTSDDLWEPTFLEKAMAIMESHPDVALCYPKTNLIDAEGRILEPYEDNLHLIQEDPVARFIELLNRIGLSHQHLGVIRSSALARTHLLAAHVASDINLLAELTLYGKFFELPERLFCRRFHEKSGSWKRGDAEHEAKTYYATKSKVANFARWRAHAAFLTAVVTSDLSLDAKRRLLSHVARRAVWERDALMSELKRFVLRTS